ncbi:hypothetical protein IWW55_001752 [Coemansia sp. RSA 2706]|nr:hypothetical protein IWW55_001752 [Coemansia sp. RSA 2706]KAJ2309850.1 hypothetical protein IWW54_003511 [Coemansia sp. RSA 2705]KAJ2317237.1 hypothetical protein IWW52_003233 [Coemansia sp. RSA 2704]KAJ2327737.1 hypothetical protein IWW51_001581 [Coemansia sp. RSA 2702]KAJ2364449.1 hypothetical protein H4S01_003774 [Coemansia sp. RSA 2610]KAJ2387241.1 hypothetical protein H4S02_003457 [Coemansia sp. RSA 2611]
MSSVEGSPIGTADSVRQTHRQNASGDLEKQQGRVSSSSSSVNAAGGGRVVEMSAARRVVVFVSLALTMLLASLDLTIVTTAVPKIALEFQALSSATWIATAYMLTTTALQPLYGKLSDTFGRVPTLVSAIAVFMAGSAACGWAPSMGVLIFGRALQGIGGAGLLSLVFIIISDLTTEEERPAYMGVLGAVWSVASVIGPVLGGVFSDRASWRWAFWLNLPIAAPVLAIIVVFLRLPLPRGSLWQKLKRVDFLGSLVLIGGVVLLLLGLTWGGKTYAWGSPRIVCLLVFGVVLLGAFIVVEWRVALAPTVPVHLFRNRNVALCVLSQFFMGVGMYATMFFIPIWYTIVKNSSSIAAGLHLLPFLLSLSLVSVAAGFLVARTKMYRPFVVFGAALFVLGAGLLVLFDEDTNMGKQIGFLLIMGFGLGLDIQILLIAVQTAAPVEDMASATTLYLFMRVLGSSIGIAILQSVLQNAVIPKLDLLSAQYPDYARVFGDSLNDQSVIYKSSLPDDVRAQLIHYYVLALQKVFIANVPFAAVAFVLVLGLKHIPIRKSIRPGLAE